MNICREKADAGDGDAMAWFARMYREGKGVPQNIDKAAEWMRKAADKNVGWAKNELFDILWRIDTPESLEEMVSVATEFTNAGDAGAMLRLGRAYRDGKGVEKDFEKSIEWMRKASEKTWWLGREFADNLMKSAKEEHHKEAFELCSRMVEERNDGEDIGRLGRMHRDGRGVEKDLDKAAEWMRKAADEGIGWATPELFDILWQMDTPDSLKEMRELVVPLAKSGDARAMGHLARMYRDGRGVEKDLKKAAEWGKGNGI